MTLSMLQGPTGGRKVTQSLTMLTGLLLNPMEVLAEIASGKLTIQPTPAGMMQDVHLVFTMVMAKKCMHSVRQQNDF